MTSALQTEADVRSLILTFSRICFTFPLKANLVLSLLTARLKMFPNVLKNNIEVRNDLG